MFTLLVVDPISLTIAVIGLISALGAAGISYKSAQNTAELNQQTALKLAKQEDETTKEMWNMTNMYNDPKQQMIRLKEAGLNPNLAYGTLSDSKAGGMSAARRQLVEKPALQLDPNILSNATSQYFDVQQKQAQTDNVRKNTQMQESQAILNSASTAQKMQETARSKFDLQQAQELKQDVLTAAKLDNDVRSQTLIIRQQEADRARDLHPGNIKKQTEEVLNIQQERLLKQRVLAKTNKEISLIDSQIDMNKQALTNAKNDQIIKEIEIDLKNKGINSNDPYYIRIMSDMLQKRDKPNWREDVKQHWNDSNFWKGKDKYYPKLR